MAPDYYHDEPLRAETPVSPLIPLPAFPLPGASTPKQSSALDNDPNAHLRQHLEPVDRSSSGHDHDMSHRFYGSADMARSPSAAESYSSGSGWTSGLSANPSNVHPAPAYVAAFGASQVVSDRKRRYSDDEGDRATAMSARDDMQFSTSALGLANAFLDQLLYSFLANAMSTSLTALRPAVRDVLRSRLAAEAIASADEELQELLAGGDEEEEEMNQRQTVAERHRRWDTELVWKRTRLRVMVYIRLGEMEDDDEERYVREDELFHGGNDRRFSHSSGLVSWAAAIFLTSIIEYVAEQTLNAAAQAADSRARRRSRPLSPGMVMSVSEGVTVEDYDMEKVALSSTLGRLWRTWRKSLRTNAQAQHAPPTTTSVGSNNFSRRFSRDPSNAAMSPIGSSFGGPDSTVSALDDSRRHSVDTTNNDQGSVTAADEEVPEAQYPEHVLAANIPLPIGDVERDVDEIERPEHVLAVDTPLPIGDAQRDVDEIEVPGLAVDPDADVESSAVDDEPKRRNSHAGATPFTLIGSMVGGVMQVAGLLRRESSETTIQERPVLTRQRSASVPSRPRPKQEEKIEQAQSSDPEAANVAAVAETDVDPEQQPSEGGPSAQEHVSQDVKPVTDTLPSDEPAKEDVADQRDQAREVLGTATAGSAAAAAAAYALVYGSKLDKKEARKSMPAMKETDFEERDKQKHLIDMKRLSMPPGSSRGLVQPGKADLHPAPPERFDIVPRTVVRPATADTDESFSLGDKTGDSVVHQPIAKPRHLSGDFTSVGKDFKEDDENKPPVDIGVARTSDTAMSTPRADDTHMEYFQARDSFTNPAPRRPTRLILGANEPDTPPRQSSRKASVDDAAVAEVTPESFLSKRSLSLTVSPTQQQIDKTKSQLESHQPARPVLAQNLSDQPKRASVPSALVLNNRSLGQASPALETPPSSWRQSFSAGDKSSQWTSSPHKSVVSEPSPVVQEHPVIQKTMKRQENKTRDDEQSKSLTSASIKGPEDFEMFVQGGDTVKYTLTPGNVRDDASHEVSYLKSSRSSERAAPSPPPQKQSPPLETRTGRSHSIKHATAADPNPADLDDEEERLRNRERNREKRKSISRPPVRNTSVHRKSGLMAREPQVQTESTRDFADFIRSTGPNKEQEVLPIASNRSTTSLHSLRQPNISGSRSSSPGPISVRSLSRSALHDDNVPPVPPMPNKAKSTMQPRPPTSSGADGSSELIDFIRTGPNGTSQPGEPRQHRISRSVAPFRTTMDSDQFNEWGERLAAQPDLKLNTSVPTANSVKSATSMKSSARTSANSRAPLVGSNVGETVHPAHSGAPQRLSSMPRSTSSPNAVQGNNNEPIVKRQYRNKDPYPLDDLDDDDDDDLLTALPRREQESLIDFLRSSEPPVDNYPRGYNDSSSPQQASTTSRFAPRTKSAPGFKTHGADAVSVGASPLSGRRGSAPNRDGPQPAAATKPAMPLSGGTTTTIAVGPLTKPRPKMEARSGNSIRPGDTGTNDLADFLRSSGPPVQANPTKPLSPSPVMMRHASKNSVVSDKNSRKSSSRRSFLSGLFSRSSAPKQRGYLDM